MTKITEPFITKAYKAFKKKDFNIRKYIEVLIIAFIYFLLVKSIKVSSFEPMVLKFDEEKINEFYNRCAWHRYSHQRLSRALQSQKTYR